MKSVFCKNLSKIWLLSITILCANSSLHAQSIKKYFKNSELNKWSHCGVLFYDIDKSDTLFKYQSNKYFIPASTTKTLTFYAALTYLPDSLTAFKYQIEKDTLYIWGVGNPTIANPVFQKWNEQALNFLKNSDKNIVLCYNRYQGEAYGKGWMWDDYLDMYQPEINEFPIHGNLMHIQAKNQNVSTLPNLKENITYKWGANLKRNPHQNVFELPTEKNIDTYVTYIIDSKTTASALGDVLGKKIGLNLNKNIPADAQKVISSIPRDTVLKEMMQQSDNFIAEQLHLMICDQLNLPFKTSESIEFLKKNAFNYYTKPFEWVDGSGLSRYNLLSPELLVNTFNQLYQQKGADGLFPLLAIGGKYGTLKNLFDLKSTPYVFGKTGTLTSVASLSGILVCKSGKKVSFALMANNHLQKASEIRKEFEKLINFIYQNY